MKKVFLNIETETKRKTRMKMKIDFTLKKKVAPRSEVPGFEIGEIFEDKEETPRDMPDLETEDSARERKNKKRQRLKILTSELMLSRLPISLAHLKAGNNSEKIKNEIRQLFYSLYRSKKLSMTNAI